MTDWFTMTPADRAATTARVASNLGQARAAHAQARGTYLDSLVASVSADTRELFPDAVSINFKAATVRGAPELFAAALDRVFGPEGQLWSAGAARTTNLGPNAELITAIGITLATLFNIADEHDRARLFTRVPGPREFRLPLVSTWTPADTAWTPHPTTA